MTSHVVVGDGREWGAKWRNDIDRVGLIELCSHVIELLGVLEEGRRMFETSRATSQQFAKFYLLVLECVEVEKSLHLRELQGNHRLRVGSRWI